PRLVDTTTVPPNARQARCHSGLDSAECTTLRSLSRFLKLCKKVSYKQQISNPHARRPAQADSQTQDERRLKHSQAQAQTPGNDRQVAWVIRDSSPKS
ncbi:MAG: hypothetical protein NT013_03870, partial [Planctomycetia bacterium]|nr:hypothetical protein [Planctomycetia bacterium]